ncbi:MAG: glycosyltransferase family 2 protein [Paracoccaceae bacterium]
MTRSKPGETLPRLTVIAPFYRDAAYLGDALASIFAQGIDGIEVIVINDNPSPRSDAFLAEMATKFPLRVLRHERNRGLSAARNTGIDAAAGAFIAFLDADDYFLEGGLADQLNLAEESGADLTHAPSLVGDPGAGRPAIFGRDRSYFQTRRAGVALAGAPEAQMILSCWNSIYRRDFLNAKAIRFDEAQRRFEDRLFVLEAVTASERLSFLGAPTHVWRRRAGSITRAAKAPEDRVMQLENIRKCLAIMRRHVGEDGLETRLFQVELFLSLRRLVYEVELQELGAEVEAPIAEPRDALREAVQGLRVTGEVHREPFYRPLIEFGAANPSSHALSEANLPKLLSALQVGDWAAFRALAAARASARPPARAAPSGQRRWRELVVHAGLHKTGTTALQRVLEGDRERLAGLGVLFPRTGFVDQVRVSARRGATPGHAALEGALMKGDRGVLDALHAEIDACRAERVILSCENFSFPTESDEHAAEFADRFFEEFARFDEIRVVVFVRRPDAYVDSLYRELLFLGRTAANRPMRQFVVEWGAPLADMRRLTRAWARLAPSRLRFLSFEDAAAGGLAAAFYGALDLPAPPAGGETGPIYRSPSRSQALAALALAAGMEPPWRRRVALNRFMAVSALPEDGDRGLLLTTEERLALITLFEGSSAAFLDLHGFAPPFESWRESAAGDGLSMPADFAISADMLDKARLSVLTAVEPRGAAPKASAPGGIGWRISRLLRGLIGMKG